MKFLKWIIELIMMCMILDIDLYAENSENS